MLQQEDHKLVLVCWRLMDEIGVLFPFLLSDNLQYVIGW